MADRGTVSEPISQTRSDFAGESVLRTSRTDEYAVITKPGLLAEVGMRLRLLVDRPVEAVVITDRNVEGLYARTLTRSLADNECQVRDVIAIEPGERSKSLDSASMIWDRLADGRFPRRGVLVALGGGVVTDLTGYVAACFMRGVPYVNVPTTLLAQHDAAVGSKVAVNHGRAKNLIGAFHHPLAVYNDPSVLTTLSDHELRQGIAEAIKVAVIGSPELFDFLETRMAALRARDVATLTELVARAVSVKCRLLAPDFYERDLRRGLNFGHAIGHALETATGYDHLSHGDAISIGMAIATKLAQSRGLLDDAVATRIIRLLSDAGLPTGAQGLGVPAARVCEALSAVQSIRNGHLYEVLPTAVGQYALTDDLCERDLLASGFADTRQGRAT